MAVGVKRKTYYLKAYHRKEDFLRRYLKKMRWVETAKRPEFVFCDREGTIYDGVFPKIRAFKAAGAKIVLYQHGAMLPWWYDGLKPPSDIVDLYLAFAPAAREFVTTYTNLKVAEIGWAWCQVVPFTPVAEPKRILFAPVHPTGEGILKSRMELNARVLKALLELPQTWQIEIRHIGTLEANGIWHDPRITYHRASKDGSTENIDRADVVIGEGTFLYLSVARGRPSISIGAELLPVTNRCETDNPFKWHEWKHLVRYPYDFDDAPLPELIERATREEATAWRERNIGAPLSYTKLTEALEGL